MTENEAERKKNNIFFVHIKDKAELYESYMPFIDNGALFVHTDKIYHLDDEVFLMVKLIDEPEKFTIAGKVVWITPACAQSGKPCGIGVRFTSDDAKQFKNIIETYLAGALKADRLTDTL